MAEDDYAARLQAAKESATAQLLFRCARLWNELGLAEVRRRTGHSWLRASHLTLLPHLDLEGTRATVLADRLGVSKQAAGALISELEGMGVVEKVPDPADGRAKLVRFTRAGRAGLLYGLGTLKAMEVELAKEIGEARMAALHDSLLHLQGVLEARLSTPAGEGEEGEAGG